MHENSTNINLMKDLQESDKKKRHDEFLKEFKHQKNFLAEFPWIKQKRSISLLNNLEEYLEMQNPERRKSKKENSTELNVSKLSSE